MPAYETAKTKIGAQFSKSVGGSVKSLFTGKVTFELEHLTQSKNYDTGNKEVFNNHYLLMGRAPKCGVIYDYDEFPYVSSEHAAIENVNGKWVLKHLSKTNPTLVNNVVIRKEYFLQNEDIIRLSFEGPELKFILPTGDTPKMNFTSRTALLRKQITVHYKIFVPIFVVLFLGLAALAYYNFKQGATIKTLQEQLEAQRINEDEFIAYLDSLKAIDDKDIEEIKKPDKDDTKPRPKPEPKPKEIPKPNEPLPIEHENFRSIESFLIKELQNDIQAFETSKIIFKTENKTEEIDRKIEGVGFFVASGTSKLFFTTREMIAPWDYFDTTKSESYYYNFNQIINSANPKPEVELPFKMTKTGTAFKNTYFSIDTKGDYYYKTVGTDGSLFLQQRGVPENNWARTAMITHAENVAMLWDASLKLNENDTLYICAISSQEVIVDMCILKSMSNTRIETLKCSDLISKNGAPVVYVKRGTGPKDNTKVYAVGMVTGYPDQTYIIPLKSIISK